MKIKLGQFHQIGTLRFGELQTKTGFWYRGEKLKAFLKELKAQSEMFYKTELERRFEYERPEVYEFILKQLK